MFDGELSMTAKEMKRIDIIKDVEGKRLKQREAAEILGCTTRNIKHLVKKYKEHGPKGLVSKKRHKTSNHRFPDEFKSRVLSIIKNKYLDFGPTFASEMLLERDGLKLSKETAKQWMIEAGIWKAKQAKNPAIHQPRARRSHYGSLVQIDGSPHDWFEGRSAKCSLLLFIDDATSKIQLMRFFPAETTLSYFNMRNEYIKKYGLPVGLYSDKHSIFRINIPEAKTGTGYTQFGRAMEAIGIELIHAHSPQAKGRVENKNSTLQDRLVKEMRLDGINNMAEANGAYLDAFAKRYDEKFAVLPQSEEDMHVPPQNKENLALHFTLQEPRKVSKNLTISYKGKTYNLKNPNTARRLCQAQVIVCEDESGEITVLYKGQPLESQVYDQSKHYSEPATRKELDAHFIKTLKQRKRTIPAADHPWRKGFLRDDHCL
jgi:transposase